MHIAPDLLLVGLLSPKTFTLRNMPPPLSFCAEPKSEVAESIIRKITLDLRGRGDRPRRWVKDRQKHFLAHLFRSEGHLLLRERGDRCRWWVRAGQELFLMHLLLPETNLLPKEKGYLRFLKKWILQLRASPACRMT